MSDLGTITGYFDVAQVVLYLFWGFFAGLIYYLHRENKREGYPLESDRMNERVKILGFPTPPQPKTYTYLDGSQVSVPGDNIEERPIAATPLGPWPGAPLVPDGNPMIDGVGPAAYTLRENHPDLTLHGEPRIAPLSALPAYGLTAGDVDPRGFTVVGLDDETAGTVSDIWIDRADPQIRYLQIQLGQQLGDASGRQILMPINFAHVFKKRQEVKTRAIKGEQFAWAPVHANLDHVTLREEDQISAFFASGFLYATPERAEPLL